jgi:Flp pilus assembly protein TadG
MGREQQGSSTFLRRLLRDTTANVLILTAASMFPLLMMVGGGVDAGRYYMAAARMQQACDAGALAARRAMTDDSFRDTHRGVALNFFDQNFSNNQFGTRKVKRDFTSDGDGKVIGEASGEVRSSIMRIFGYYEFDIEVTCSAEINISNTDIMFVLDTTGSMSECPNGSQCNSGPTSKIVGLRAAVMNFYDTVEAATSASAQVRYGFVPYSQQVNVGFLLPREFLANRHVYQSRVARFDPPRYPDLEVGDPTPEVEDLGIQWLPRSTANFGTSSTGNYRFRSDGNAGTTARNFCANTLPGKHIARGYEWEVIGPTEFVLNQWSGGNSNQRAGCRGRLRRARLATAADLVPQFAGYRYCPVDTGDNTPCDVNNPGGSPPGWETVDLSTLYDDNRIQLPTGNQGAMETHTWSGCIEEPIWMDPNGNYSPVPDEAHDLNINLVPINQDQLWKPSLDRAVFERRDAANDRTTDWRDVNNDQARPGWVCPRQAAKLTEISRNDLQNFVNSLTPSGNTYHDIGMLWGARLISPRGLFRSENEKAPNGDAISRHIVFMTDGVLVTNNENYSMQGIEWWDRRVTGNGDGGRESQRRAARLQAICSTAKAEGITVWVVAFGTAMTSNLKSCASPGRDYVASDSAKLNEAFQEIAQKIAALRLTS